MKKDELRNLIKKVSSKKIETEADKETLKALWELYDMIAMRESVLYKVNEPPNFNIKPFQRGIPVECKGETK